MGTKAQRRAARDRVDTYHEARLGELVEHIAGDLDRYRTGEIDAYTLHHYHRAARELWKFCCIDDARPAQVTSPPGVRAPRGTLAPQRYPESWGYPRATLNPGSGGRGRVLA